MDFLEHLGLIKRLDYLINQKATGSPKALAQKLEISVSSVYRHINTLKALGAPVVYCQNRQSFYYSDYFELKL